LIVRSVDLQSMEEAERVVHKASDLRLLS